jgi:hypothetical protein
LKKEIRKHNTGWAWTEAEILYLIQNWGGSSINDLMLKFNRTKWAICSKKLELKKSGKIVDDGFGNIWSSFCEKCQKNSVVIVRPGDAACRNCE